MRAQELCVPGIDRDESGEEEGRCESQDVRGIFMLDAVVMVVAAVGRRLMASSLFRGVAIGAVVAELDSSSYK